MKKGIIKLLSAMMVLATLFALVACNDGGGDETQTFVNPELSNITVDVSDRPEGMLLGDATLNGVTLGQTELDEDEYIVREKYFLLNKEYYGDLGLGEYNLTFDFEDDKFDKTITITIVREKAPDFDMPSGSYLSAEAGVKTELPEITRNRKYQDYQAIYTVSGLDGTTIVTAGDGQTIEKPVIEQGLKAGEYVYNITVKSGDQELDNKNYTLVVGKGDNYFAPNALDKWTAQATSQIKVEADSQNNALKVTRLYDNTINEAQFTSNNNRIYMTADKTTFEQMLEEGYETYTFSYYSELKDGSTAGGYYGFRVYNSTTSTAGGNKYPASDVIATVSASNGLLINGKWTTVTLDLKRIVGSNFFGFMIVVCGDINSTITFKNGSFGMYEPSEDIFAAGNGWSVSYATRVQVQSDGVGQVFAARNNDAFDLNGRHSVAYVSTSEIKAKYAEGYDTLTFMVKTDSTLTEGNSTIGSYDYLPQIKVFAKQNEGLDVGGITSGTAGVGYMTQKTLTTEWSEMVIDLNAFFGSPLELDTVNYLGIVIRVQGGKNIYCKNATYSKQA